jgi:P27 family predicted phage terminase small subunit
VESKGLVSAEDEACLLQMCACVDRMAKAEAHLRKEGYIVTFANGITGINHWMTIWTKSAELYNRLAVQFGLTPAARAKIGVEEKAADDAMKALLGVMDA